MMPIFMEYFDYQPNPGIESERKRRRKHRIQNRYIQTICNDCCVSTALRMCTENKIFQKAKSIR